MIILGNELLKRSNSDILKSSVRQRNQPPQTLGFTSRTRFGTLLFHAKFLNLQIRHTVFQNKSVQTWRIIDKFFLFPQLTRAGIPPQMLKP